MFTYGLPANTHSVDRLFWRWEHNEKFLETSEYTDALLQQKNQLENLVDIQTQKNNFDVDFWASTLVATVAVAQKWSSTNTFYYLRIENCFVLKYRTFEEEDGCPQVVHCWAYLAWKYSMTTSCSAVWYDRLEILKTVNCINMTIINNMVTSVQRL